MPRYSEAQVNNWVNKYNETGSLRAVGRYFNVPHKTVSCRLRKTIIINPPVRHTCDDDFFSIDSPESFYWAGFIAADGCITTGGGDVGRCLEIGLGIKDTKHLIKFKKAINFSGKIENVKWNDTFGSRVRISSIKVCNDLKRFGVVPRKTFIYSIPKYIMSHPLINHFIRGYFDGDGCFYIQLAQRRKVPQLNFEIVGTELFIISCKNIFNNHCNGFLKDRNVRKKDNIFVLHFGGNSGTKMLRDFMYKNSNTTIRLDRKHYIAYTHFSNFGVM